MHLVSDFLLLLALLLEFFVVQGAPDDLLRLADDDVLPRRVVLRIATLAFSHGPRLATPTRSRTGPEMRIGARRRSGRAFGTDSLTRVPRVRRSDYVCPMSDAIADIGVTGLGVMGRNLARNLARHGHT